VFSGASLGISGPSSLGDLDLLDLNESLVDSNSSDGSLA